MADLQKPGSPDLEKKKPKVARRMTGKCWMAEDFPMSLTQLLPVLEVIGNANKHIARVAKFLHKYGDMSLFPVKLQVGLPVAMMSLFTSPSSLSLGRFGPSATHPSSFLACCFGQGDSWEEKASESSHAHQ